MDDHNIHNFWGLSPSIDLLAVATRGRGDPNKGREALQQGGSDVTPSPPAIRILQVASYDARHTIHTLCHSSRHDGALGPGVMPSSSEGSVVSPAVRAVHLHLHEEEPEGLARHLLLLSVLLDGSLPTKDRIQTLLEIHGNALVRQRTAEYLDQRGRALEDLLVALGGGASEEEAAAACSERGDESGACLAKMLDLSMLKFQERDLIVEALQKYRLTVEYDMVKAWDVRGRRLYADRFDFRKNMIDWDYHMRLMGCGTPGQDPALGSIVHFHHFRHWRMHGVAYELRDSAYGHPNRSMLSMAYGRTKEFKDNRTMRDVGRSVSAWGFWGDLVNPPYLCFGLACPEEPSLFSSSNKQFTRTAIDVAEHNLMAMLTELRTGKRYEPLPAGGQAHRAKVARGPTSIEDLKGESAKEQLKNGKGGGAGSEDKAEGGGKLDSVAETAEEDEGGDEREAARGVANTAGEAEVSPIEWDAVASSSAAPPAEEPAESALEPASSSVDQAASESGLDENDISDGQSRLEGPVRDKDAGAGAVSGSDKCQGGTAREDEEEARRLREEEETLDSAARLVASSRFRLSLSTGSDLVKALTGRSKVRAAPYDVITLGHRHMHLAGPAHGLDKVAKRGALMLVETAHYMLQLKKEQAEVFESKVEEICTSAGWTRPLEGGGEGWTGMLADGVSVFARPSV